MNFRLLHDFLLVKESIEINKIEGTDLNIKYDDNEHYLVAEIIDVSENLPLEYAKYYPILEKESPAFLKNFVANKFKPGNKVVLRRIAKVPYKDGLYFVSFKDIIAVYAEEEKDTLPVAGQISLFENDLIKR